MKAERHIFRITRLRVVRDYILELEFDDGARRVVNMESVLHGELLGPLRDPVLFARVTLDPECGVPVWPNGADFDAALLHDWSLYEQELAGRLREGERARMVAERGDAEYGGGKAGD